MEAWQADFSCIYGSGLFDHDWYNKRYPDVVESGLRPLEHYIKYGARMGRYPSPTLSFDVVAADADPSDSFVNPLAVWVRTSQAAPIGERGNRGRAGGMGSGLRRPKVSVLCITYNQAKFIRQTLDSILMQDVGFEFELLVGDDGSTDGTAEIVADYALKYTNISAVLRDKNIGANANFIDLASRIRGEYVATCEGDDYWTDTSKLQLQADFLDKNPQFTVCFHQVRVIYEGLPGLEEVHPRSCRPEPTLDDLTSENLIQTNSVMYRWRFVGAAVFEYDVNIAPGDWYVHLLHAEVGRVGYVDRIMAVYRKHQGGIWSSHETALARHKKHGNGEIEFFRQLCGRFGGRFDEKFKAAQRWIFRELADTYIDERDFARLLALCKSNYDIASTAMAELGYELGAGSLGGASELRACLDEQSSVSVIVTCYNQADYIRRCLNSILQQRGSFKLQVVVGDDCSTDGTANIVQEYRSSMPDCVLLVERTSNVGMLKNMQECISVCTGQYIAFCEGDDYWLSDRKIAKQLAALRRDKSLHMCFSWVLLHLEADGTFLPHPEQSELPTGPLTFARLAKSPLTANFSCCFYRAEAVRRIPESYFSTSSAADWLFNLYVADTGGIAFLRELLSVYTVHSKGQWSGLSDELKETRIAQHRKEFSALFGGGRGFEDIEVEYQIVGLEGGIPPTIGLANLDRPKDGSGGVIDDGQLTVEGWVLAVERHEVFIVAQTAAGRQRFGLNVLRPDVIEAVLNKKSVSLDVARCGFRFTLPFSGGTNAKLYLETANRIYPWVALQVRCSAST